LFKGGAGLFAASPRHKTIFILTKIAGGCGLSAAIPNANQINADELSFKAKSLSQIQLF